MPYPGELAYMSECVQLCQMIKNDFSTLFNALALMFPFSFFLSFFFCVNIRDLVAKGQRMTQTIVSP